MTASPNAWITLGLALFFLVMGALNLVGVGGASHPASAAWQLLLAAANGGSYTYHRRGGPRWLAPASTLALVAGVGLAVVTVFF